MEHMGSSNHYVQHYEARYEARDSPGPKQQDNLPVVLEKWFQSGLQVPLGEFDGCQ